MKRSDLVTYLDDQLNIKTIADFGPQGLQVEGSDVITRLAVAVDSSHASIDAALATGAEMLLVHHGIFWGPSKRIAGAFGRKVRRFINNDLNLYAAHLALDAHPTLGNNAELCRVLGLEANDSYFNYKGLDLGIIAQTPAPITFSELVSRFTAALQAPLKVDASGPEQVHTVAICSGDAAHSMEEAFERGCDTLVTGELNYTVVHTAAELGINVLYGGHYVTETLGVQALARHLQKTFDLPWNFIDLPVGQ